MQVISDDKIRDAEELVIVDMFAAIKPLHMKMELGIRRTDDEIDHAVVKQNPLENLNNNNPLMDSQVYMRSNCLMGALKSDQLICYCQENLLAQIDNEGNQS